MKKPGKQMLIVLFEKLVKGQCFVLLLDMNNASLSC